ncbi:MAG: glycosyltransferase family 2 protein, partial [Okeania sp. SIO3B3]|nr:glycosyltransferase family 2 protein [Okeania sp. SIO3B3]NEP84551.1 glycosyltransferase family 2 protein [Okeania sp. SIO3B3]
MKFSIVITTYNRLDLLKRAINSALEQTVEC